MQEKDFKQFSISFQESRDKICVVTYDNCRHYIFFKPALMNFNNSNTCMYYNFTMNKKTTLMNSKTEHYQVLSVFH